MSNILLINDNVQDYQTIINACNDNTYPITYNQGTDTYDSIFAKYENMISENNIQIVNHLALVSHGSNNPEFTFLEKENKMLISQYLPDLSNCASCQTNETQDNDLSLNDIDELFDNTLDVYKYIVDLSLNLTSLISSPFHSNCFGIRYCLAMFNFSSSMYPGSLMISILSKRGPGIFKLFAVQTNIISDKSKSTSK